MKIRANNMVTIEFDTKDNHKKVVLKDIENFKSAGCRARLIVNSNGFMCDRPFEFDNTEEFLDKIKSIKDTLQGEAKLSEGYSDNYILLKASSLGHIEITGQVFKFDDIDQSLEFGFVTDQTCLDALVSDFSKLVE